MAQANYVNGTGGTIAPSVFVVTDTGSWKAVNQAAGTSAFIVGISQEYPATAPIPNASTVAANSAGDTLKVYQIGDICLLAATTAGWTAGQLLSSNASGQGLAASSGQYYGALALTTITGAAAGALGQVQVIVGKLP